ncbi:dihydrofolate reductase-like domain-containing protein [Pisolithus orientalis]|uniref:dihydrofolate reductase-like domain-containing protein n=1 Tax=Pisolithus orientalis TaxID=936130 RepID=UPI0022252B34|nr:dihydrofolate reductase-like domain-containing protein [Pisolithus orientalis]KAI6032830.1 dihydrofolate reductase-like domain-containing protein [Pisolithus orientalis]
MSGLTIIVAATRSNGIGHNGKMPWHIPKDLAFFSRVTARAPPGKINAVVMGRATWESIPSKFRPLRNRLNAVLSRNSEYPVPPPHASLFPDLQTAIDRLRSRPDLHRLFIIGGSTLYRETLGFGTTTASLPSSLQADRVLLTRIHEPDFPECDVFLPDFLDVAERSGSGGSSWKRASHDELVAWASLVDFDIPEGVQEENGVKFEFQMWLKL